MSNSSLVSCTIISPNKNSPRKSKIDTITIHCMAGQLSAEDCGKLFASKSRQASSNYGIGPDGKIGLYVEEKDRSWASSNGKNDHRAITIEVASDSKPPYAVKQPAYDSLIKLLVDICKRNNITKLIWSDKKEDRINHRNGCNMTCHKDFKNKECPGSWIYEREGKIAEEVNRQLNSGTSTKPHTHTNESKPVSMPSATNGVKVEERVRVIEKTGLNIRSGPGTNYPIKGVCNFNVIYTIIEYNGTWGKLKSGAGWINCSPKYVTKLIGAPVSTAATSTTTSTNNSPYQVGKNYILQVNLRVRKGPGTNNPAVMYKDFTDDIKAVDKNKDSALDKGGVITCKEVKVISPEEIWIRISCGWVMGLNKDKYYVK